MADEADIASEYIEHAMSRTLNNIRQNSVTLKAGAKACTECGEKIPDIRRKLGFQLCVECAAEAERLQSLFAD